MREIGLKVLKERTHRKNDSNKVINLEYKLQEKNESDRMCACMSACACEIVCRCVCA